MDRLDLRDLVVRETGDFVRSRGAIGDWGVLGSFSTLGRVRELSLGSSKLAMSTLEDGYKTPPSCLGALHWLDHNPV